MSSDYILREYIADCFEHEALECDIEECRQNAAFQLAFCCWIGFGRPKDDAAARNWLQKCRRQFGDLRVTVQMAAQVTRPISNLHVNKLISDGFLHQADCAERYQLSGRLNESEAIYKREIMDMESALGNEDVLTALKVKLSDILEHQRKFREAEAILQSLVAKAESDENFSLYYFVDVEAIKARLANVLFKQGANEKALACYQSAISSIEERVGKSHPQALAANVGLATLLQRMEHYERAETILRVCIQERKNTFGPDYPGTITAIQNLATVIASHGRPMEGLEMMRDAVHLEQRLLGPDEPSHIIGQYNLAVLESSVGHYSEAEKQSLLAWKKVTDMLGAQHHISLLCLEIYGVSLLHQRKDDAAESPLRQAFDGILKVREREDRDVLHIMCHLAILYQSTERYADANETVQAFFQVRNPSTIEDTKILFMTYLLASNFLERGMHRVSEQLILLTIEGQEKVLGASDAKTLLSTGILVDLYLDQSIGPKAEMLSRAALEKCSASPTTQRVRVKLKNGLSDALQLQGKYVESEKIHRECLNESQELDGMLHLSSLTSLSNLGLVLIKLDRISEAEDMCRRSAEGFEELFGPDHIQTLMVKGNLAHILFRQDRFHEAAAMFTSSLDSVIKLYGPDHHTIPKFKNGLENTLAKMNPKD